MRKLITGLALALLSACATTVDVTDLGGAPGRPSERVELFASKGQVKRPFREVAVITGDDGGWGKKESEITQDIVAKAKEMGADAVILTDFQSKSDGGVIVGTTYVQSERKVVRAIAIVYTGR